MDFFRNFVQRKLFDVWNLAVILWFCKSCLALCPSDVQTYADNCFSNYNMQLGFMQSSDRTFFSGVDVENLRHLCSSYKSAIKCIQNLHNECPPDKHKQLDVALVSIHGAQTDLSEICKHDTIIEVYARNQNCFIIHGKYSESCFERAMGFNVSNINDVSKKTLSKFCSDMKSLNSCISTNILLKCGKEAESLVDILIKASIKRSTECDYTVPLSQTSSSGTINQNRNGQNNPNSGNSLSKNYALHTTLLLCLIFLFLKHSVRL